MECLSDVIWVEKTNVVDELLRQKWIATRMPAGLEASVVKFCSNRNCVVLKIWDKGSDPDVQYQHDLLGELRRKGIPVSNSYGWGYTAARHKVLLTSYDGNPLQTITDRSIMDLANLLLEVHKLSVQELERTIHRRFDFIGYFYPKLDEHQDIKIEVRDLVQKANLRQNRLIHGDFNLGNILVNQGMYTMIDWTNAQLGDTRYDFAWACLLIYIYNGEERAALFRDTYLTHSEFHFEEIRIFEAIACLRWLLLNRIADIPRNRKTIERVNDIIMKNDHLNKELMLTME